MEDVLDFGRDASQLGAFAIDDLVAAVRALSLDQWAADASRQKAFDAHSSTQTIKLIADADFRHSNPTILPDYHRFAPYLAPLVERIRGCYTRTLRQQALVRSHGPGYLVRTLLTRLPPHTEIRGHVDDGFSLKRAHRIHVPLITNDRTKFRVGDRWLNMRVGEMWEINNRRLHAVKNEGSDARVHLILDYVQPGETVFDAEGVLTA